MQHSWLVTAAVASATAFFLAAPTAPQGSAPQRMNVAYGEWWVPYIGKAFYLSADWTVATEKTRTSAVPVGAVEFSLAAVGLDFAIFDSKSDRVCVPLTSLRAVLKK